MRLIDGICPICKQRCYSMTKHHILRRAVWGRGEENNQIILICEDCHRQLEAEITKRENAVLRLYPGVYLDTLDDFMKYGPPCRVSSLRKKRHNERRKRHGY